MRFWVQPWGGAEGEVRAAEQSGVDVQSRGWAEPARSCKLETVAALEICGRAAAGFALRPPVQGGCL